MSARSYSCIPVRWVRQFAKRSILGLAIVATVLIPLPALPQSNDDCQFCHADETMFDDAESIARLVVNMEAFTHSVHGEMEMACVDCHQDLAGVEDFPHDSPLEPAGCALCHDDVEEEYAASLHGYARDRGNERAPTCASCHGKHGILPSTDIDSNTHRENLAAVCEQCHGTAGVLTHEYVKRPMSVATWAGSVHGLEVTGGNGGPTCADCHGIHTITGVEDSDSPIHGENVSTTCGKCHEEIADQYDRSIHGMALAAGVHDSPSCTDCHGEHQILVHDDPDARTSLDHIAGQTCGVCHNDPNIIAKYGLRGGVVGSYEDSYHGWATSSGYEASASCVSCHTAHEVLPAQHPDSTVHADNVVATCQACHPRADVGFAESYAHDSASITANPITLLIRNIYWVLIPLVIGGMLLHNIVIIGFFAVERHRANKQDGMVPRMDGQQLIQHLLLIISFTGLVVTGFALRYPNVWWVDWLAKLGMTEGSRSWLHRAFGVMMIITSAAHVFHLAFTRNGRSALRAMIPVPKDVTGFIQSMKFHTRTSTEHPTFGRYDYTQKAEYWALVWGTVLMAVTGLILWFPAEAVRIFPAWIATVAQTLHYYEAWLATLAILVWHLFFVLLHPQHYPMDWSWIDGKMPESVAKHHHGEWYDELMAEQRPRSKAARGSDSAEPASNVESGNEG